MQMKADIKKIALFVEGQTEQIFMIRFVQEFLGKDNVYIIIKRSRGGTNIPKQEIVRTRLIGRKPKYMVLICDCGADNRVKSEVMDNANSLKEAGYKHIIGIRDLYPLSEDNLKRLTDGLNFLPHRLNNLHNLLTFIVMVQEMETVFLDESSHLLKVDKRLNGHFIKRRLGFDPFHENAITRKHPSSDLNSIYKLVGKSYSKKYWQVKKLVNKLDFNNIKNRVRYDLLALNHLFRIFEDVKKQ